MTDRAALIALRDAVQESTGPDREIDAQVMFDLFAKPVGKKSDDGPMGYLWPDDNPSWSFGIRFPGKDRNWFKNHSREAGDETLLIWRDNAWVLMNSLRIPPLTASIDATERLRKAVLPDSYMDIVSADNSILAKVYARRVASTLAFTGKAFHPVESIARLLAILNALISHESCGAS